MKNDNYKKSMLENYGVIDIEPLLERYAAFSSQGDSIFADAISVCQKKIELAKRKQEVDKILSKKNNKKI